MTKIIRKIDEKNSKNEEKMFLISKLQESNWWKNNWIIICKKT